jgi:hypothetical protein
MTGAHRRKHLKASCGREAHLHVSYECQTKKKCAGSSTRLDSRKSLSDHRKVQKGSQQTFGKICHDVTPPPPCASGMLQIAPWRTFNTVDFPHAAGPRSKTPVRIWSMEYVWSARETSSGVGYVQKQDIIGGKGSPTGLRKPSICNAYDFFSLTCDHGNSSYMQLLLIC